MLRPVNDFRRQTTPGNTGAAEPGSGKAPVPIWLFILLFLLLYWGMVYFDLRGGWFDPRVYAPYHTFAQVETWQPVSGAASLFSQGKAVYNKPTCVACHQADGNGVAGLNPPLGRLGVG